MNQIMFRADKVKLTIEKFHIIKITNKRLYYNDGNVKQESQESKTHSWHFSFQDAKRSLLKHCSIRIDHARDELFTSKYDYFYVNNKLKLIDKSENKTNESNGHKM
jgi:hypothetical protein